MKNGFYKTFSAKTFFICFFVIIIVAAAVFLHGIHRLTVPTVTNQNNSVPTIIIDAGHGGEDGGTQSDDGVLEKEINLSISKKVHAIFQSLGFQTIMIRDKDVLIYDSDCKTMREKKVSDIHKRMDVMKNNPNSIFLSIHQNHFSQSKYSGAQVFYSKKQSESETIAEAIQKSITEKLQPDNVRQIKPSGTDIYLLYHAVVPAVMVECGFMSNPEEAKKLNDDNYQTKMALAIVDGVIQYLKSKGA